MLRIFTELNKLSLPLTIVVASVVLGGFYFATQISKQASVEKQQNLELEEKREAATKQASVDQCISDAYTELKTLQGNLEVAYLEACSKSTSSVGCNADWVDETKKDWFTRYEKEWIPQCKLGNRVFIDYEHYNL